MIHNEHSHHNIIVVILNQLQSSPAHTMRFHLANLWFKADTHRTRFGNAARFFIFKKQINRSTIENFGTYEKQTSPAVEILHSFY